MENSFKFEFEKRDRFSERAPLKWKGMPLPGPRRIALIRLILRVEAGRLASVLVYH